ncbi:hypothetical protein [Pontibacter sp. G13]|uniref:hypothetical protein n=1 Tax=Pontibacter sp. G13 TaxID=3074898 RepID=UPI00288B69CD|nr:hypothetical protein [Pontibacter sp. G13]WNJ16440.1 hypothetical protein RJD25_16365 [Pontibacter sp. G13]
MNRQKAAAFAITGVTLFASAILYVTLSGHRPAATVPAPQPVEQDFILEEIHLESLMVEAEIKTMEALTAHVQAGKDLDFESYLQEMTLSMIQDQLPNHQSKLTAQYNYLVAMNPVLTRDPLWQAIGQQLK